MKRALDSINEKILAATRQRPTNLIISDRLPRLVAVSKFKPISSIIEAYECGQRYFGENYIQELEEKSNSPEIIEKCPDIKFHFIGHLQSNKVNKLLKVRNLYMMETIDSIKLASLINQAVIRRSNNTSESSDDNSQSVGMQQPRSPDEKLKVMIQINTSGEEQKNGIQPDQASELAAHVFNDCKGLELAGLMTIGKFEGWGGGVNQDFVQLYDLRQTVSQRLGIDPQELELSMGMSSDFEEAIRMGSTNVRVGTLIFGERT